MLPIRFEDALAARERIRAYLQPTPLRSHEALDEEIGAGIRIAPPRISGLQYGDLDEI